MRQDAHQRAMAEARLEAMRASVNGSGRESRSALTASQPEPVDDSAAETASLLAFRATVDRFTDWPSLDSADATVISDRTAAIEAIANRFIEAAEPEPASPTFETRDRWEDFKNQKSPPCKTRTFATL